MIQSVCLHPFNSQSIYHVSINISVVEIELQLAPDVLQLFLNNFQKTKYNK